MPFRTWAPITIFCLRFDWLPDWLEGVFISSMTGLIVQHVQRGQVNYIKLEFRGGKPPLILVARFARTNVEVALTFYKIF